MKIKTTLIVMGMLLSLLSVKAQTIKPLSIGDTVPDLVLHNVVNYRDSVIRLSDFKDKLVILDFWATWCTNCFEKFPELTRIQDTYGKKVQVLLVNASPLPNDSLLAFLGRRQTRTGETITLPIVNDARDLNQLFPRTGLPYMTIVGHNLIFKGGRYAEQFDKGELVHWISGDGTVAKISDSLPTTIYSSCFTGYRKEHLKGMGMVLDHHNRIVGFEVQNKSLPDLLRIAYSGDRHLPFMKNRTFIDSTVSDICQEVDYLSSTSKNYRYCYSLHIPPSSTEQVYNILAQDIERAFSVAERTDTKEMECLVIRKGSNTKLGTSKKAPLAMDVENRTLLKYVANATTKELVDILNQKLKTPVIDDAGGVIGRIELPNDLNDLVALTLALKNVGLTVSMEHKPLRIVRIYKTDSIN